MFEIISRVLCGILPIAWIFCFYMYFLKGKLEKTTGVLTIALTGIGIISCILSALG